MSASGRGDNRAGRDGSRGAHLARGNERAGRDALRGRGVATSAWLLRGAERLVLARYPERGPEIVATARAGATDRRAALAEAASLVALALRPAGARTVWLHGAVLAAALVLLAALTPLALVAPFVLLGLGIFDARLAAGATLFWLFRLVTADVRAVVDALGDASLSAQVVRWLLMLAGLALAAHVTRASIRRAATL